MSQLRDDVEYTSSWVREPQGRGTLSILYTCTFTLLLCVYTAIHLNIPPAGEPRRWQILRKVVWMFFAIFAPEVVLFTAAHQFWNARRFCQGMDFIRAKQGGGAAVEKEAWWKRVMTITKMGLKGSRVSTDADPPQSREPFSMTYGFYVVMGGLTVDVSDMHNSHKTLTLSSYGVEYLADRSSWEHFAVSDTVIHDKSKADTLAKSLVILQVSWLFLQCVACVGQGRPLTILEVHTLVHAVCAMLMYGLWFKKPLDIRDATVVDSSGFVDDLALELLGLPITPHLTNTPSNVSGLRLRQHRLFGNYRDFSEPPSFPECEAMSFHPDNDQGEGNHAHNYQIVTPGTESGGVMCTLHPEQILHCGLRPRSLVLDDHWYVESWTLTGKYVMRWNRAARARSNLEFRRHFPPYFPSDTVLPPRRRTVSMYAVMSLWSDIFHEGYVQERTFDIELVSVEVLMLIMAGYGAIHLALWNFAFPSHAEMVLWKVSACTMVSTLPLCLVFFIREYSGTGWYRYKASGKVKSVFKVAGVLFGVSFVLLYVFARIFIVVESYLSLRMVPVGVYEGITWADYIPHL